MAREVKSIKFSDEEWAVVESRAEGFDLAASTYVRRISTGQIGGASVDAEYKLFRAGTQMKKMREALAERGCEHDSIALGRALDTVMEAIKELTGITDEGPDYADAA